MHQGSRTVRRAIACVVFVCAISTSCSTAGVATGGIVLGGVLSGFTQQVQDIVRAAGAEANLALVNAANQVQTVVDNTASAYGPALDKAVTGQVNNTVEQINGLIGGLRSGVAETVNATTKNAQQLILTLPFTRTAPQVTSYTPTFTAGPSSTDVQVKLNGVFAFASDPNLRPVMRVPGLPNIYPNLVTTQEIGFAVPAGAFPSDPTRTVQFSAEVEMPYTDGFVFQDTKAGVFRVLTTVLPPSPFRDLTVTTAVPGVEQKASQYPVGGGTLHLDSFDCKAHMLGTNGTIAVSPDPGWRIVPSTAQAVVTYNKTPRSAQATVQNAGPDGLTLYAQTEPACFLGICNGCGSIDFFVQFTQERAVLNPGSPRPLALRWGESLVVPVTARNWVVNGTTFNGRQFAFSGTSITGDPYLSVVDNTDSVRLATPSFDSLLQ